MKRFTYSKEIANIVKKFLEEDEWYYSFDEERGIFEFGLRVKGKIRKIRYIVDIRETEILVYGICPIAVDYDDKEVMAQMAEFICRANFGLKNGGFEFDFNDGEIRYKSFIDCDGALPVTEIIKNSIYCVAKMYDRYEKGITDIIFGGGSAKKAVDMCEKTPEEELRSMLLEMGVDPGDGDIDSMLTRLEESIDITDDDSTDDTEASEEAPEVHFDLFDKKTEEE
ncbi:hypothetical protein [Blautia sp.]